MRVLREKDQKNILDKMNSICEGLEERESMKLRERGRSLLQVEYKIRSRIQGERKVYEINRVLIMKGFISYVKGIGVNFKVIVKLEKVYKQECDKIILVFLKYYIDYLGKVNMQDRF